MFFDWHQYWHHLNSTAATARRRRKIKKLRKALNRINKMQRRLLGTRARTTTKSKREQEFLDDFLTSAFSSGNRSLGLGFLTTAGPMSTAASLEIDSNICDDIRGRDRACCNSAVSCFDELQVSIEDISQASNDFSLLSACRRVSSELKRDKQCVKQAVSRCDGPGRALLLRRFDNRITKLYNQFYRHCTPDALWSTTTTATTTTTTTQEPETKTNGSSTWTPPGSSTWESPVTKVPPPPVVPGLPTDQPSAPGHFPTHGSGSRNTSEPTSGSIAIIAGAVSGGIILVIVLLIALILWCRSRNKTYDSNSTASSAGIFFQKKPNMFSTDRPRPAHGKRGVKRQESSEYAEIDERFMNRGFRPNNEPPPLPEDPPLPGYLRPISEAEYTDAKSADLAVSTSPPGTPESLKGLGFSTPPFATRGQLKYGPILAANANGDPPLFHLGSVTPSSRRSLGYVSEDNKTNETVLSAESFDEDDYLAPSSTTGSANRYITMESEPYERPSSARSSANYDQIQHETDIKDMPQVSPRKLSEGGPHRHNAVKVLPSNPLTIPIKDSEKSEKSESKLPVAKPRRTKLTNPGDAGTEAKDQNVPKQTEESNNHTVVSATKSNTSNTSHHYFVLEPHVV